MHRRIAEIHQKIHIARRSRRVVYIDDDPDARGATRLLLED